MEAEATEPELPVPSPWAPALLTAGMNVIRSDVNMAVHKRPSPETGEPTVLLQVEHSSGSSWYPVSEQMAVTVGRALIRAGGGLFLPGE